MVGWTVPNLRRHGAAQPAADRGARQPHDVRLAKTVTFQVLTRRSAGLRPLASVSVNHREYRPLLLNGHTPGLSSAGPYTPTGRQR